MMAGQDRSAQVIEATAAAFATVALAMKMRLVMTVTDHGAAGATGTANTIGPTVLTNQLETFFVVDEGGKINQLGGRQGDTD